MKFSDFNLPVTEISPKGEHFFFGYYDLQPYNLSEKFHLAHKTNFINRLQTSDDICEIGFIEIETGKFISVDKTNLWNFQQGSMLQWNPKAAESEIIYNSLIDGEQHGIIADIHTGRKFYLDRPVANISKDGKLALSINMSRLYDFRPGYGYAFPKDKFSNINHSNNDGVFLIDMETGKSKLILSLEEIWDFTGKFFNNDQKIIINHITFNPDASRFVMLVRNFPIDKKCHDTAVITANTDGSDMYLLSDYGIQSHYYWLNNQEIIFFAGGNELACKNGWGNNYIMKDKSHEGILLADGFFNNDNHMSFNLDNTLMVTDSYPDSERFQSLMIYSPQKNACVNIGKFYSIPSSITDIRCDLHPRWNRKGNKITFDSTHEGYRGIYCINLDYEIF